MDEARLKGRQIAKTAMQQLLTCANKDKCTEGMNYCSQNATTLYPRDTQLYKVYNYSRLYYTKSIHCTYRNLSISSLITRFCKRLHFIPVAYAESRDDQSKLLESDNVQLKTHPSNSARNGTAAEYNDVSAKVINFDPRADAPKLRGTGQKLRVTDAEVDAYIAQQSGFSRIRDVFFREIEGEMHHDLSQLIWQSLVGGFAAGLVYGARGRELAEERFRMSNKGRLFLNKYEAAKSMSYARSVGLVKMGLGNFAKISIVVFVYMGSALCIRTYNNKDHFWDYPLAGFVCGAVWRSYYGAAAALVGGMMAGVLSLGFAAVYYPFTRNPNFGMNQESKHRAYTFKKLQDNKLYGLEGYGRTYNKS